VKTTGYAAYGLEDRTPRQVASMYDKRSQIEKSYEKFREARAMTSALSPVIRLFYAGVGFLLEQLWLVIQWAVLAQPQRGGRTLSVGFAFDGSFLHGIERESDADLGWKKRYRTNGVGWPAGCEHGFG